MAPFETVTPESGEPALGDAGSDGEAAGYGFWDSGESLGPWSGWFW